MTLLEAPRYISSVEVLFTLGRQQKSQTEVWLLRIVISGFCLSVRIQIEIWNKVPAFLRTCHFCDGYLFGFLL